jgi:hypothetical protein
LIRVGVLALILSQALLLLLPPSLRISHSTRALSSFWLE